MDLVATQDGFGLASGPAGPPIANDAADVATPTANAFRFMSSSGKLEAFKRWLNGQIVRLILGTATPGGTGAPSAAAGSSPPSLVVDPWEWYVREGFRKGAGRAYDDTSRGVRAAGASVATTPDAATLAVGRYAGARDQFLRTTLAAPVSVERVQVLVSRTFTDIEGVTSRMATTLTRVLADGLTQGKHPRDVAKEMADKVDMSNRQAEMVARTELSRAHSEGQLDAFEAMGVDELGVMVEWLNGSAPCPRCEALHGIVVKLSEARGMIPVHPRCVCCWTVANVGEVQKGQKRTKPAIDRAIKRSRAEAGAAGTAWGPATAIAAKRPEGVV